MYYSIQTARKIFHKTLYINNHTVRQKLLLTKFFDWNGNKIVKVNFTHNQNHEQNNIAQQCEQMLIKYIAISRLIRRMGPSYESVSTTRQVLQKKNLSTINNQVVTDKTPVPPTQTTHLFVSRHAPNDFFLHLR